MLVSSAWLRAHRAFGEGVASKTATLCTRRTLHWGLVQFKTVSRAEATSTRPPNASVRLRSNSSRIGVTPDASRVVLLNTSTDAASPRLRPLSRVQTQRVAHPGETRLDGNEPELMGSWDGLPDPRDPGYTLGYLGYHRVRHGNRKWGELDLQRTCPRGRVNGLCVPLASGSKNYFSKNQFLFQLKLMHCDHFNVYSMFQHAHSTRTHAPHTLLIFFKEITFPSIDPRLLFHDRTHETGQAWITCSLPFH